MERAMRVVYKKMLQGEVEAQDSWESSELSQRSLIVSNRRGQGRKERHSPECSNKILTQLQEIWVPYRQGGSNGDGCGCDGPDLTCEGANIEGRSGRAHGKI